MWIFFLSNLGMGASPVATAVVAFSFVDPDAASLIIVVDTTGTTGTVYRLFEGGSGKRLLEGGGYRLIVGDGGVIPGSFADPDAATLIIV